MSGTVITVGEARLTDTERQRVEARIPDGWTIRIDGDRRRWTLTGADADGRRIPSPTDPRSASRLRVFRTGMPAPRALRFALRFWGVPDREGVAR